MDTAASLPGDKLFLREAPGFDIGNSSLPLQLCLQDQMRKGSTRKDTGTSTDTASNSNFLKKKIKKITTALHVFTSLIPINQCKNL